MNNHFRLLFRRFLLLGFTALAIIALLTFIFLPAHISEVVVGYVLSFIFVGTNFLVLRNIRKEDQKNFYRRFYISTAVRFVLVLATITVILSTLRFHQISFTVSFIISYILHSVNEIITIEKLLQKDN